MLLIAILDADYIFMYLDVEAEGKASNSTVFNTCELIRFSETDPPRGPILNDTINMPYFLEADDAFKMTTSCMKPYPHRGVPYEESIYNCWLSHARWVVECTLGTLPAR